jgi:hypothetical protein
MNKRFLTITAIIFVAAICRYLPHLPNFTPLGAMALFAGAFVSNRFLAIALPLCAMLLSDAMMGFEGWAFAEQTIAVYATYALITLLGFGLTSNKSMLRVGSFSLASSVLFFLVTNLFTWVGGFFHQPALYPLTTSGLMECYVAGIPFFSHTVASDLLYSVVLFGGFYLLQINIPSLKEENI